MTSAKHSGKHVADLVRPTPHALISYQVVWLCIAGPPGRHHANLASNGRATLGRLADPVRRAVAVEGLAPL